MMKSNTNFQNKGFTIIEVLVATSIIGILTSVILSNLNDGRVRAEYSVAIQELRKISDTLILTEPVNARLEQITGSGCSDCICKTGTDLRDIPASDGCVVNWTSAISIIDSRSSYINGTSDLLRDPWGSPYGLDENELEWPSDPCRPDTIRTVGVDGIHGTSDDFIVILPFRTNECM